MKKHKNKIIAAFFIVIVLAFAFWYGGNSPGFKGGTYDTKEVNQAKQDVAKMPQSAMVTDKTEENSITNNQAVVINEEELKEKNHTEPSQEDVPVPAESENTENKYKELTCTLSVRCDTILDNIASLDSEKIDIVHKDGVIFAEKAVTFFEGESVFDLLVREMKQNKIHLEFVNTPMYKSTYIEGIANIYEFDCGELSGWMYKVNDRFPNYGCSRYQLKPGDRVEFVYTCDLGADVGGEYASGNRN